MESLPCDRPVPDIPREIQFPGAAVLGEIAYSRKIGCSVGKIGCPLDKSGCSVGEIAVMLYR